MMMSVSELNDNDKLRLIHKFENINRDQFIKLVEAAVKNAYIRDRVFAVGRSIVMCKSVETRFLDSLTEVASKVQTK